MIARCFSLAGVIVCCLAAVACGASARPFTAAVAKRPFLAEGFIFGCPSLQRPLPNGLVQAVAVAPDGTTDVCDSNLGSLSIYRSAAKAMLACSGNFVCGRYQYRIRNLVLSIHPADSTASRSRLLQSLRSLGRPARIA